VKSFITLAPGPRGRTYLGTNFLPGEVLSLERHDVDFGVGVAHVADDGTVLQLVHVLPGHDALVASCSDHDVHLVEADGIKPLD
jgi:hypothetical protein